MAADDDELEPELDPPADPPEPGEGDDDADDDEPPAARPRTLRGLGSRKPKAEKKPKAEPAPRRRASASGRVNERRRKVAATIRELVELRDELGGVSTVPDEQLADVLRRDADAIASAVAWIAERLSPLGLLIDKTMGAGGLLSIAQGLSGLGRYTIRRWRDRVERLSNLEPEPELPNLNPDLEPELEPPAAGW